MQPIGVLMREHRLIERLVVLVKENVTLWGNTDEVDHGFIDATIDFLRSYADRCHHGKEEDILFRDLAKKQLSIEHKRIMDELIQEHINARKTVGNLEKAKERLITGDTDIFREVLRYMGELAELYPRHIEKEDKRFFHPSMGYFTKQELDGMLREFNEFDMKMIHEKYQQIVETLERSAPKQLAKWECLICGYIYDPKFGDPQSDTTPGTAFEEIPDTWRCPICNAPKEDFKKLD